MKKIIAILLLPLYLFSVIGFNLHLHYCGGELAAASIITNAGCDCEDGTNGIITEDDGCCKNESQFKKFDTEHALKNVSIFNEYNNLVIAAKVIDFNNFTTFNFNKVVYNYKALFDTGPPRLLKNTKILLLNCSLKLCA